jgi:hypothetical protein
VDEDKNGVSVEDDKGVTHQTTKQELTGRPFAVYINQIPEGTTNQRLTLFLTDMMKVAYKEVPTIVACSVRRNDAYVAFQSEEQVYRAVNLRNRIFEGRLLNIIPWDPTFKIPDYNVEAISNSVNSSKRKLRETKSMTQELHHISEEMKDEKSSVNSRECLTLRHKTASFDCENEDPALAQTQIFSAEKTEAEQNNSCLGENKVLTNPNGNDGQMERHEQTYANKMANILKRQLDAMRLDRDHWKYAYNESQKDLRDITAQLASTRAILQIQQGQKSTENTSRMVELGSKQVTKKATSDDFSDLHIRENRDDTENRFDGLADWLSHQIERNECYSPRKPSS